MISRLVLDTCDFTTKLPQRGETESLNVAQAATALCFEWMRRNRDSLAEERPISRAKDLQTLEISERK